jgi:hypothetical protein
VIAPERSMQQMANGGIDSVNDLSFSCICYVIFSVRSILEKDGDADKFLARFGSARRDDSQESKYMT